MIDDVRPMRGVLADAMSAPAATASLLVALASLAVARGCVGVYGVLSLLVSRQTHELGIRLALGAQRRDLFWPVMKEGGKLCALRIIIGLLAAVAFTRWLSAELYGITPTDPMTYAAVAVIVACVTFVACDVPTRRAMGADPLVILREQ